MNASDALSRLLWKTTGIVAKDSNAKIKPLPKLNKAFQTFPTEDSDSDSDEEPINVRDCQRELAEFDLRVHKTKLQSEFEPWSPELDTIAALPKSLQTLAGVYGRLKTMQLTELEITSIDDAFPIHLEQLNGLDLSSNRVVRLQHLPPKLSQLDAYNNRIETIDVMNESLIHLGLGFNTIATFPTCPSAIMSLDLCFNSLTSLVQVATVLPSLPSLKHLFLHGNPMALCVGYRETILQAAPQLQVLDDIPVEIKSVVEVLKPWDSILLCVNQLEALPPVKEISYQLGRLETYRFQGEAIVHELKPSVGLRDAVFLEKLKINLVNDEGLTYQTELSLAEFLAPASTQTITTQLTLPVDDGDGAAEIASLDLQIEIRFNQI